MDIDTIKLITSTAGGIITGATSGIMISELYRYLEELKRQKIENILLEPQQIVIGYKVAQGYKVPIIIDMKYNPHMIVFGCSQQGKTSMVEYALRNKKVLLINCFEHDFTSINPIGRVNDMQDNISTLNWLCDNMSTNREPLFVVIDEILDMIVSKRDITGYITRLLATSAHYKIYIICLSQAAEKDIVKFRSLFNAKVCFSMGDDVCYKTALGYIPEYTSLQPREMYYSYGNNKGFGHTYDL